MNIFSIKLIACITMVFDHIKYGLPVTENFVTTYLGRISFPLFAFLITEGYVHTSNLKKYYQRLLIFGIISQIPFMLFRTLVGEWKLLNIMFTLLIGLIAITIYDKEKNKFISIPIMIALIFCGEFLNVDYGAFGIITVILMYMLKNKKVVLSIIYGVVVLIYYGINYKFNYSIELLLYCFFTWFPSLIICMYNGKQRRKMKYFFYCFYPIHMLIVYLLSFV